MSPRYTRPLAEKIMAVAGTFAALKTELDGDIDADDPIVQAELIRSSVTLALASDTKDLGLLSPAQKAPDGFSEGAQDQDTDPHGDGDEQ